jgi:O-antigen ligase
MPQPPLLNLLDGVAIFLLLAAPLAGTILFGAVRMWSIGPLMILSYLGIAIAALRRLLFLRNDNTLRVPVAGWGWLAWLLYAAFAAWRSTVSYESRIEWLKIASYVGAYWAWTDLGMRRGRWRWLLGLIIFWVTLIAWYALIQHAHGSRMVLGLERPPVYGMRASGTYICPNHFAALLEIILPLSMALVLCPEAKAPLRLLGGYALLICLPVMFLTMSRSGWLGTLCGIGIVVAAMSWRKSVRAFVATAAVGLLLAAAMALAAWRFSPAVRERVRGASLDHPDPAVQARLEMWRDTRAMIRSAPWLGYGPGSYMWAFPKFKQTDAHMLFNYAHNEYLHTAAEYGMLGLALMGGVVLWMVIGLLWRWRSVHRARDAALIAALFGIMAAQAVHAIFDFNLHIFSIWHVLALIGGIVVACLYASDEIRPNVLAARAAKLVFGGWAAAALVLAMMAGQAYAGYGFHRLGEKAWDRLQLDRAERMFRLSAKVDPRFWRAYQGLGHQARTRAIWCWDAEEKKVWARKAVDAYEKAWALQRLDPETPYAMATAYNILGEQERALALMQEVVKIHPTHLFYLKRLGLQLRQMGRYREALELFRDIQRRWGTDVAGYNIAWLEEQLKDQPPDAQTR